jgi:ubiquinol-cytochrome c reductase cytochrome b subunit
VLRRLWKWTNDRWPVSALIRVLLLEDVPGGASYFYSIGYGILFVFIVQAVTGICQLFFYVPTVDHAYASLSFLRTEVPFGWLIHNLHYWGATAMVVLVLLHVTRVFLWGAYKDPRQVTWLLGVLLFLVTMAMMFTGSPLPWDEKGYWATEVGTSMAGMTPLVGGFMKGLLRGGENMGQLTLSRFFVLHVALLAGLLGTFIVLHLVAFRRTGSVGPWSESKKLRRGPFWPDQAQKDMVAACVIFLVLVALSAFLPPPFTGQADPADQFFTPKPEWNFLFLYQALKIFPGSLEVVGTVLLPLVLVLLFLAVPFIDRSPERNPAKRPLALGVYFAFFIAAILLSIAGGASRMGAGQMGPPASGASSAAARPSPTPVDNSSQEGARLIRKLGCLACHSINGTGGKVGPDLAGERGRNRSSEWLGQQIRNPSSHNPKTVMPSFDRLPEAEIGALTAYLLGLTPEKEASAGGTPPPAPAETASTAGARSAPKARSGNPNLEAARIIGNARHGGRLFGQYCQDCHGAQGRDNVPNPGSDDGHVPALNPIDREIYDPNPVVFVSRIDPLLQHGSVPPGPHPALRMPDFGDSDSLTQQQIAHLEAYVLSLNGVRRDAIVRSGVSPSFFFILVAAVFALSGLALAVVKFRLRRRPGGGRAGNPPGNPPVDPAGNPSPPQQ